MVEATEVKAAHGWSLEQAAKAFLVTAVTIIARIGRIDEQAPPALVQLRVPASKFPVSTATASSDAIDL
jgi:predicted RNA polymerase sigma factor